MIARVAAMVAVLAAGCGQRSGSEGHGSGRGVVATVGSTSIRSEEVTRLARERGIAPRLALTELEDRALLASYAERHGLGGPARMRLHDRVLVQALLARVERDHPESAVTALDVESRREAARRALVRPRRRAVTHLLVAAGPGTPEAGVAEAARIADEALSLARTETSLEVIRDRLVASHAGASITVEHLPRFDETAPYEAPFVRAAFTAGEGLVPEVVRTTYGFHVLRNDYADDGYAPTDDDVTREAISEVLIERRSAAASRLVDEARARVEVDFRAATVARLLDDDALFEAVR